MNRPTPSCPPEIDVLITVYNGESFISQTIDSVISQTFSNWRLLIVDDKSTDRTAQIVRDYANQDSRILLIPGPHKGIAAAANVGLREVCAPLVARLDADDIALPERLEIQRAHLQKHPELLAIGTDVQLIDENNKPLRYRRQPAGPAKIRETLRLRNCIIHPSSMLRTEILHQIGGYREKFRNSEDYDLWLRISEIGGIDNLSQGLTLYRRHGSQITAPSNTRRLTLYSVGAAVDHFLRKSGNTEVECLIDEAAPNDIAEKLALLYQMKPKADDLRAINRHAIRFLRISPNISTVNRNKLLSNMRHYLTLLERLKLKFYTLQNKTKI
ncbi:MAG: glycosyltransferase [Dechloromonas sp.]|nr:glycosyltransferase [Dechloromonas sp.]